MTPLRKPHKFGARATVVDGIHKFGKARGETRGWLK